MNWVQKASCKNDKNYSKWLSYDLVDIDYAKKICSSCPVKKQCMIAFFNSTNVGVIGGISEYERLLMDWREVTDNNGDNWR